MMIKLKFNCSTILIAIFIVCYFHQIVHSFQNPLTIERNVINNFENTSPKRRSFFETVKNGYQIIPKKLKEISIMNMLGGKKKNRKPNEDDGMYYSDLISNPAVFTNVYSEKLAPQFQSIFSELDESYAKNPPPNLVNQLALKPNGGLSFQPIIEMNNNQQNVQDQRPTNNEQNSQINSQLKNHPVSNQVDQSPASMHSNKIQNMMHSNAQKVTATAIKDNNALGSNIINSLFGGHQPNKNAMYFVGPQSSKSIQHNKLGDTSLTASASSSPFSKQHFTSLSSLTTNLLNLKNKFSNQKSQNYFKSYKNYKETMYNHQMNNGAMLASANQYNYFQQRPTPFQQQSLFNRYQMISSLSKKKCGRQCPNQKKNIVPQQKFNTNYNGNNDYSKQQSGKDYESNLINNNVRQKQFYSIMQERQRPTYTKDILETVLCRIF